jgi:hypothetical protein
MRATHEAEGEGVLADVVMRVPDVLDEGEAILKRLAQRESAGDLFLAIEDIAHEANGVAALKVAVFRAVANRIAMQELATGLQVIGNDPSVTGEHQIPPPAIPAMYLGSARG